MNSTTCTTTLLLLLLTGFPPRVAGAGTCACDNNGFDLFGTEKCWKTEGTPKKTCTAATTDSACTNASGTDCAWAVGVCIETGTTCSTNNGNMTACKEVFGCQWNLGTCGAADDSPPSYATELCSTYLIEEDCTADSDICKWTGGTSCSGGCRNFRNSTDCGAHKDGLAAGDTALCEWTDNSGAGASNKQFCGCALEGQNSASTPVATCYATATAQPAAYCTSATVQGPAATAGTCSGTGARADYCSWFGGPIPSASGTCGCSNFGKDEAGTEKCWKTAGTIKTACTNAGTSDACSAASVNDGDCAWAVTCDCAVEGMIGTTPTCFKDAAQEPTFCTGFSSSPITEGTDADTKCGHSSKAGFCEWMKPDFPKPATTGACACVNPGFDLATGKIEKCFSTPGTLVATCTAMNETACAADDAADCAWTAGSPGSCGCANKGNNAAGVPYCYKDAGKEVTYCPVAADGTATTKTLCGLTATSPAVDRADFCKWMIAESACAAAASPTPCPESSASAPGALLAILAGLLAYLRC